MTTAELYDIGKKIERSRGLYAEDELSLLLSEKEGEFYEFVSTYKGNVDIFKILLVVMKTEVFNYYKEVYPYLVAEDEEILRKVSDDKFRNLILEMAGRIRSFRYEGKVIRRINAYLSWIKIIIKFYPDLNKPQFGLEAMSKMSKEEFITMHKGVFPWLSELNLLIIYFALKRIGEIPDMEAVVKSDKAVSPNDKQKGRKADKFSDCIVGKYEKDTQIIIDLMKNELAKKSGKAAAEVIYAVMQLGYIRKPTQAEFYSEFKTEVGERLITANEYTRLVTKVDKADIMNYKIDEEMKHRLKIR